MAYSLDTSAILNAWRKYYPPDVFPSVWHSFAGLIADGTLLATEEVRFELERKDDEVHQWAADRPHMFVPIDGEIQGVVFEILATFPRLVDTRKNRSGADPFVIGLAQLNGYTVVTYEGPTGNPSRPHIPDVCDALHVRYIDVPTLLRECGSTI